MAERGTQEAEAPSGSDDAPPAPAAKPISGFSLGASVMWSAFVRWLKGLFGTRTDG